MSFFDIIMFGYVVNIFSVIAIFVITFIIQIIGILSTENYERVIIKTKMLMINTYKIKKLVKSYKKHWKFFTLLMPFSYILNLINLIFYIIKNGVYSIPCLIIKENDYILKLLKEEKQS